MLTKLICKFFRVLNNFILCLCKILVDKTNLKFSILNKIRIANNHEKLQIFHHHHQHQQIFLSLNVNFFLKYFDVFSIRIFLQIAFIHKKTQCHSCKILLSVVFQHNFKFYFLLCYYRCN